MVVGLGAVALPAVVVPSVPGVSCGSGPLSAAAAGLNPACAVSSAKQLAGSAASSVAGFGVNSILNALGSWVGSGATWLIGQIGKVINETTSIDLGASWFTSHYQIMVALSGVVILPMMLLGIIQSIYRQNPSSLLRSVLLNVPLAILLTAVAVTLVQLGLSVTDALCTSISTGAGLDSGHFLGSVVGGLSAAQVAGQPSVPGFVLFVGGLAVVFGGLLVWIELLIRAAAVYVAVLFLPLALASLAWPAIAHWCRRLVDTLAALVLSKFVIVAVLSLAAGALAAGTGSGGGQGGGFGAVLGGAALLLLAGFAPWALFRLLPFMEAGAVGHLESIGHRARHSATLPAKSLYRNAMALRSGGGGGLGGGSDLVQGLGSGGIGGGSIVGGRAGSPGPGSGGGGGSGAPGAGTAATAGSPTHAGAGSQPLAGSRPDPGPSSAELTGVGSLSPPGASIPAWTPHPEASIIGMRTIPIDEGGTSTREELARPSPFDPPAGRAPLREPFPDVGPTSPTSPMAPSAQASPSAPKPEDGTEFGS